MGTRLGRTLKRDLILEKDDHWGRTLQFKVDGELRNISHWTVFLTVKEHKSDSDDDALVKKDITSHDDPTNGTTSVKLTHEDTRDLPEQCYYDIQVTTDDDETYTLQKGTIWVKQDITIRR